MKRPSDDFARAECPENLRAKKQEAITVPVSSTADAHTNAPLWSYGRVFISRKHTMGSGFLRTKTTRVRSIEHSRARSTGQLNGPRDRTDVQIAQTRSSSCGRVGLPNVGRKSSHGLPACALRVLYTTHIMPSNRLVKRTCARFNAAIGWREIPVSGGCSQLNVSRRPANGPPRFLFLRRIDR